MKRLDLIEKKKTQDDIKQRVEHASTFDLANNISQVLINGIDSMTFSECDCTYYTVLFNYVILFRNKIIRT